MHYVVFCSTCLSDKLVFYVDMFMQIAFILCQIVQFFCMVEVVGHGLTTVLSLIWWYSDLCKCLPFRTVIVCTTYIWFQVRSEYTYDQTALLHDANMAQHTASIHDVITSTFSIDIWYREEKTDTNTGLKTGALY